MQFYPADWIQDTRKLNRTTKADWVDLLCAIWVSPEPGKLDWTLAAYARHLGINIEMAFNSLTELLNTGVADGEIDPDVNKGCPSMCDRGDHRGEVQITD